MSLPTKKMKLCWHLCLQATKNMLQDNNEQSNLARLFYERDLHLNINTNDHIMRQISKLGYADKNNIDARFTQFINVNDTCLFYTTLSVEELLYIGY